MNKNQHKSKSLLYFRKWSRKKYAAFNSLSKVVKICSLGLAYAIIACPDATFAQKDTSVVSKIIDLDEVEVVGQKSPGIYSQLPRMIEIITTREIETSPSGCIPELLENLTNADIKQRGPFGMQSDIHIRGGSFDHTLVLLNGINISDIQTGHYNLNLPLNLQSIERIEVLHGSGARVHGANAFTGAINLVPHNGKTKKLEVGAAAGEHGYFEGTFHAGLPWKRMSNFINLSYSTCNGYIKNTDFQSAGFYYRGQLEGNNSSADFQIGYNDKELGANQYYSPRFPDQYELNNTLFSSVSYMTGKKIKTKTTMYWRRHLDEFQLFRLDENWYRIEKGMTISNNPENTIFDTMFVYNNFHKTNIVGADFKTHIHTKAGTTSIGIQLRYENILSSSIGDDIEEPVLVRNKEDIFYSKQYNRSIADVYFEQTVSLKKLFISGGMLLNWNSMSDKSINVFPGIDINYYLFQNLRLTGSYNYTVGLPTFTDLLYYDPSNEGNIDLRPYSMHSVESGFKHKTGKSDIIIVYFRNKGSNIIDWVWHSSEQINKAVNINSYKSQGVEFSGSMNLSQYMSRFFSINSVAINYTYLDMEKELTDSVSKYYNLKHKLGFSIRIKIKDKLGIYGNVIYQEREGGYMTYNFNTGEYVFNKYNPYWLSNIRISWKAKKYEIYATCSNLMDITYVDAGSLTQPGRWSTLGIRYRIID